MAIETAINAVLGPITGVIYDTVFFSVEIGTVALPFVVIWLIGAAVFFTIRLGFINLRGFGHAVRLVRGDYSQATAEGDVSHWGALSTALSGTVGVGNVAGVALAISLGGPGAAFWMVVAGFLGMTTKFVECTLAVKYRRRNADGSFSGGPMYFLPIAFSRLGLRRAGVAAAGFFAVATVFGSTSLFPINQAYVQFSYVSGLEGGLAFGIVIAVLVGLVIIGGIRSIAKVTGILVPIMCGSYILAALAVILSHAADLPGVVGIILADAFSLGAVGGGFVGSLIIGFQRAAYSGEAGLGSAAIAHSAARTSDPIAQGFVALLEPFFDTVVVCSLTALVIVSTGLHTASDLEGIEIASAAFASVFPWFPPLLALTIILFAISTLIAWAYYGERAWGYLFGETPRRRLLFKALFLSIVAVAPTFSIIEAIRFLDAMIFAMAFPNICALYLFSGEIAADLKAYWAKVRAHGAGGTDGTGASRPAAARRLAERQAP